MKPFFKNFYDSKFPDVWFSLAGNTLITAAAMVVWGQGSTLAGIFAVISYVSLIVLTTHGTRRSYEYLKEIYVYPHEGKWHGMLLYLIFFIFRIHVIMAPFLLVWWAHTTGKVLL